MFALTCLFLFLDVRSQAEPPHFWRAHLRLCTGNFLWARLHERIGRTTRGIGEELCVAAHFEIDLPVCQLSPGTEIIQLAETGGREAARLHEWRMHGLWVGDASWWVEREEG